jgi:Ca2+-binding EF-hand superfamily protein
VDGDGDGVLDEAEMRSLIRLVAPKKSEGEVDDLLDQVDPWNHQHITFSEAVKGLSEELFKSIETKQNQTETTRHSGDEPNAPNSEPAHVD